ncbi:MAG: hypothetical protein EOM59_09700 [Clostridia bacterium]|nr:hypothetical protein [Clostridia bacterium]
MDKNVKLKSLRLLNFKGIKELTVNFGEVTTIAGANATGKSTIFDAFTWCLFGKDSNDRTDSGRGGFTLKTVDSAGKVIEKLEHEVTAVLSINGEETTITRTLTEDWVKPRGKAETELKGNTTHYLVNGVEIKAGAFQEKVAAITEEQLFKLITNPSYFPSLSWQNQREILLRIAGGVTYEEVAIGNADFLAILAQLSGKDLAEYKQEIAYRKKKIQEGLDKCPIEINAIESVTPVTPDYEALEADNARIATALEEVDATITNVAETARKHYEKVQAKRKEINDLRSKQQDVIFAAKQAAQKAGFEKNAKRNEAKNAFEITKREADNYNITSERELSDIRRQIEANTGTIAGLRAKRESKLTEWEQRNADEYKGSAEGLICPIYKTLCSDASVLKLDVSAKDKAKATFEATKDLDLERITKEGQSLNTQIEEAERHSETLEAQLKERTEAIATKKAEFAKKLTDLAAEVEANPVVEISTNIEAESIPEWQALDTQIKEIAATIEELPESDTTELTAKKKSLTAELDEVKRKLSLRTVIENNNAKKAEIQKKEKELAQQKADLEGQEFTIDALNKAQMDEVERRVNSKFQNVRFRMFETQLNGGEIPTCVALVNGVKYSDLNTAGKINAGLDIINTLCLFHGVNAPVFIDNAESINKLFPVASQLIKLVVTTDKELVISQF